MVASLQESPYRVVIQGAPEKILNLCKVDEDYGERLRNLTASSSRAIVFKMKHLN